MSTFLQDRLAGMGRPIIQFWCKNDELSKRRPSFVVSTLLSQLLDHPELSAYQDQIAGLITKQYNKHKDITKVSIDSLCGLLESVLSTLPPVMIIIDALDECDTELLSRDFLIEKLTRLSNSVIGTKVILTSRQEEPFVQTFEHCSSLEMSKDDVSNDIEAVIRYSIESAPKLQSLKERVTSALVAGADGMFLWAELMLATLKKARNRNAVEKMLANLPVGLREVYEHILISIGRKISEDELQLRREIFSWVTTAARPMTLEELSIALAIETGTTSLDDGEIILRLENDVRDLCGPMLRISGDRTVQIVHMSVRDTLHSPAQISGSVPQISPADLKYLVRLSPEMEHARLASACITYLAFETFREKEIMGRVLLSREELPLIAKEHLMLEYATSHWIDHISASANAGAEFLDQILQFLQSDNVYVWIQLVTSFNGRSDHNFSVHFLQRSKLLKWVENSGKRKDSVSSQILNDYLPSAIESGVRLSQILLGLNHVQTLKALQRLACLYDHEDRLEESRTIQQKLIDATSTSSAPEYRQIFYKSCIELAYVYRVKSDYDHAIDLLERVLGGPDPSQWTYDATGAEAMADLGVVYRSKGELEKAREMAERGAEGLTVTLGPTHLMTIRYVIQLCRTYFACGMYAEAQTLLEETLETADEVIGTEESVTLHGRDLLGNILHAQGDLDAAEKLLREVLRLMRAQWGENGRSTALLKTHVADVLADKSEFAEAIVMYQGALETYEGLHGVQHPDTRGAAVKLGRCYGELGLLDSAETVMVKYRLEVDDVRSAKRPGVSKTKEVTPATETPKGGIVIEEKAVTTAGDDEIVPPAIEMLKNDASLDVKERMCDDFEEGNVTVVSTTRVFDAMHVAIAF
jgi:tetratricopeptide (TPR) repeat protein